MNLAPEIQTAPSIGNRVLSRGESRALYQVRLAGSRADVQAAQTLRFLVFNLELNEGLAQSYATCRDADPFDDVCDHLLVEDRQTGEVVGTYRLQPGTRALRERGFYSAQEFDFAPLLPLADQMIELGRACVHSQHRNLTVLGMLWKGIAAYAQDHRCRYLIGCSSVPSVDAAVGASVYADLQRRYLAPAEFLTKPVAGWECPLDQLSPEPVKVPKLLTAYLSIGARICGQPALDREFSTIDFLTVLDLERVRR